MTRLQNKPAHCMQTCLHLFFALIVPCLAVIHANEREREREEGTRRWNAVRSPIGILIITLSGGHKSSGPHLCQVRRHWLSNEGCVSFTMFTIDHCVSGSQQAARYDRLLLHLNSTVIAALIGKQRRTLSHAQFICLHIKTDTPTLEMTAETSEVC